MSEFIYIFRTFGKNSTALKFGYSKDEWSRLRTHEGSNPFLEIVYKAKLKNAFKIEQEFHSQHKAVKGLEFYPEELLTTMLDYLNQFDHIDCTDSTKPKSKLANLKITVDECKKDSTLLSKAYIKYPFLQEAIIKLGYDGIEKCGYQSTNIKRKLIQISAIDKSDKVINSLKTRITLNTFISASDLKQLLADIYIEHNIETKAKASDINLYYETKQHTPRINNKPVAGFIIKGIISCLVS